LLDLAPVTGAVLVALGLCVAVAAARRHANAIGVVITLGMVPIAAIVVRAMVAAEPIFSWRPVAGVIRAALPAATEIVFEAPQEYQQVGALAYYTGRRIALLEPPGYVPPTYLVAYAPAMFLPRAEFARRWQSGRPVALVTDPQSHRETPDGLAPGPAHVIGRFGDRWVLANVVGSPAR
jgi:hypothetical protein